MIDFSISRTSEEEVRKFLRDNYKQFDIEFSVTCEDTDYSYKLYSKSSRFELWYDKKLIGMLCVYFNRDLQQAYIPYICVCNEYKGKGLGSVLLEKLIDYIKKNKSYISFLALEVLISNISAQAFYSKFQFKEYSRNELKIQMRKQLIK